MDNNAGRPLPENEITRREFVAAALSAGFALAGMPISAQTITTDSEGLAAGDVQVPVSDGNIPAYRAMPAAKGSFPVVLVVHEIFGVHEHIKDICRRFAKMGHLAIAPDLYARQGDVSKIKDFNEIFKVVSKVPDAQVMSDLDAAVAWAPKNQGNTQKLGITGFCWGGRIVWLYAAHNPKVKAGVSWYGPVVGQPSDMQPKNPIDIAPTLQVPILGLYAGKDGMIQLDTVERMRDALRKARNPSEIIVYPEAQHGFLADYRPGYRKDDAQDGWKRLQEWFKKYGAT
jgi:carboxymethylenebutenolidase